MAKPMKEKQNQAAKPKFNKKDVDLDDYEPETRGGNTYGLPASFFTDEVDDKPIK